VVLATDAVAGVPRDYADAVVENTLALVATRARVDDIIACWPTTGAPAAEQFAT
jgi:biuret amidohydrolase